MTALEMLVKPKEGINTETIGNPCSNLVGNGFSEAKTSDGGLTYVGKKSFGLKGVEVQVRDLGDGSYKASIIGLDPTDRNQREKYDSVVGTMERDRGPYTVSPYKG